MKYNIKLYKSFPLPKQMNYMLEGGLSDIYASGLSYYDSVLDDRVVLTHYKEYTDFAPFNLDLSIKIILPFTSDISTNILASDDVSAINYMIVRVIGNDGVDDQYIGYYINSQNRVGNETLEVSCSLDVLNSLDIENYIDFKQTVFTRRHKSRIKSVSPAVHPGDDNSCVLKPIDVFPEPYTAPTSISKKTEIDPDKGLRFSMIQRSINTYNSDDEIISSYPAWGIVLEDCLYNNNKFLGAYCYEVDGEVGSVSGGILSIGLSDAIKMSDTMMRYVRIPYCPFGVEANLVSMTGYAPVGSFSDKALVLTFTADCPLWLTGVPVGISKPVPAIRKEIPNNNDRVSDNDGLHTFVPFENQTDFNNISPNSNKTSDALMLSNARYRDPASINTYGMVGFGDDGAFHPDAKMLKRELQTLSPLSTNLSTGLAKLKTIATDVNGDTVFPKANEVIDPKVNNSSISPIFLVFGGDSCDVPLETFDNICNDARIVVNIAYSLATIGNFTLSVSPKSGSFVETTDWYHCTFSVYPSSDMQLTSNSYVAYMRDQRPFDLNIQASARLAMSYRLATGMVSSTMNEAASPSGVASYGATALVAMAKGAADIVAYLSTYDAIVSGQNDRKAAMASNSSAPVITTSYDIWEGITNYHAVLVEREPKPYFKDEILKDFYYKGYTTLDRIDSLVKTRWLFDFYQANLVVKPSLNATAATRLAELFNEGITVLHILPQNTQFVDANYNIPDYDNGYENLEVDIPFSIGG